MRRRAFLGHLIGAGAATAICQACGPPQVAPRRPMPDSTPWMLQPPPPAPSMAFEDVTVVPMDTERLLPHLTVLVRDGRIHAVGPTGMVTLPPGTERIVGSGRYLMPGLADMHVHVSDRSQGLLYLANGVTSVRN